MLLIASSLQPEEVSSSPAKNHQSSQTLFYKYAVRLTVNVLKENKKKI
jgi:hypothetical protein